MIAIQPAYGDAWTRRHFALSLDQVISFRSDTRRRQLADDQLAQLDAAHPDGRAHFWGGTRSQAAKISQLGGGDLVLLTGQLHVRGVGEVGVVVESESFASSIWDPHPRRCAFEVVYSFRWFRRTEAPYRVLQTALGTSRRDHFQALRLIRDARRVGAVRRLVETGSL